VNLKGTMPTHCRTAALLVELQLRQEPYL